MACKHCGAETWCEHATLPVADDQDALENAAAIAKAKAHTALDEYLERLWRRGAGEADTRDAAAALHAACDAVINAWLSSRTSLKPSPTYNADATPPTLIFALYMPVDAARSGARAMRVYDLQRKLIIAVEQQGSVAAIDAARTDATGLRDALTAWIEEGVTWTCDAKDCTCRHLSPGLANHYSGAPHQPGCGCSHCVAMRRMMNETIAAAAPVAEKPTPMAPRVYVEQLRNKGVGAVDSAALTAWLETPPTTVILGADLGYPCDGCWSPLRVRLSEIIALGRGGGHGDSGGYGYVTCSSCRKQHLVTADDIRKREREAT